MEVAHSYCYELLMVFGFIIHCKESLIVFRVFEPLFYNYLQLIAISNQLQNNYVQSTTTITTTLADITIQFVYGREGKEEAFSKEMDCNIITSQHDSITS